MARILIVQPELSYQRPYRLLLGGVPGNTVGFAFSPDEAERTLSAAIKIRQPYTHVVIDEFGDHIPRLTEAALAVGIQNICFLKGENITFINQENHESEMKTTSLQDRYGIDIIQAWIASEQPVGGPKEQEPA